MSNAERQAAWRARRQAEAEAAKKAGADPVAALRALASRQPIAERCATLRRVIEALELDQECAERLKGLAAEGKKNAATFSLVTVATLAHELGQLMGFSAIPDHLRDKFKATPEAKRRAKKAPSGAPATRDEQIADILASLGTFQQKDLRDSQGVAEALFRHGHRLATANLFIGAGRKR